MQEKLRFKEVLHERPYPSGLDVICNLKHFAIITYAVDPASLEGLISERFKQDTISIDGKEEALLSVVSFRAENFTSAVCPFPEFRMGQVNYRTYVIDTFTGERCIWFLSTILDSWTVVFPRYLWKLPWHKGKLKFECDYDSSTGLYNNYLMETESKYAPARLELCQYSANPFDLPGFPDTETGLVYLTHRLVGYYYRRDGKLGTFRVWHRKLEVKPATFSQISFGFLSGLGLVDKNEQQYPHSVLLGPMHEFTIYLPPKVIEQENGNGNGNKRDL
ncbi:MAG: DUF2071 domain-containing protein [Desulfurivibrionaceae bacterium]